MDVESEPSLAQGSLAVDCKLGPYSTMLQCSDCGSDMQPASRFPSSRSLGGKGMGPPSHGGLEGVHGNADFTAGDAWMGGVADISGTQYGGCSSAGSDGEFSVRGRSDVSSIDGSLRCAPAVGGGGDGEPAAKAKGRAAAGVGGGEGEPATTARNRAPPGGDGLGGEPAAKGKPHSPDWSTDESVGLLTYLFEEDALQEKRKGRQKMCTRRERYEWIITKLVEKGFEARSVEECERKFYNLLDCGKRIRDFHNRSDDDDTGGRSGSPASRRRDGSYSGEGSKSARTAGGGGSARRSRSQSSAEVNWGGAFADVAHSLVESNDRQAEKLAGAFANAMDGINNTLAQGNATLLQCFTMLSGALSGRPAHNGPQITKEQSRTGRFDMNARCHSCTAEADDRAANDNIDLPMPGAQEEVQQTLEDIDDRQPMEWIKTNVVPSRESIRGGEQRLYCTRMKRSVAKDLQGQDCACDVSKNSRNEGLEPQATSSRENEPPLQSKAKETTVKYPGILTQLDTVYASMGLSKLPRDKHCNMFREENVQPGGMDDSTIKFTLPPEEDEKLMPGDKIREDMKEFTGGPHFLSHIGTLVETEDHQWAHHILWHPTLFELCVWNGKWHMALFIAGKNCSSTAQAYDLDSSVSNCHVQWKLASREAMHEFEGDIHLGSSQQLAEEDGHASTSGVGLPLVITVQSDDYAQENEKMEIYVGDKDETTRDTTRAEDQSLQHASHQEESMVDKESAGHFLTMTSPKVCTGSGTQMVTESSSMQGTELTREETLPQQEGRDGLPGGIPDLMLGLQSDSDALRAMQGPEETFKEGGEVSMQRISESHQEEKRKRADDDDVIDIMTHSGEQREHSEDREGRQNENEEEEHRQKKDDISNEKSRKGNTTDNVVPRRSGRPVAKKIRLND
ncbi:hypothetical protein CBR_g31135 [Chara braunii]|uniref:Myb-like domain-containing protein n=1 Tax=Chara braunii TaxID=69332 RepID=A0A388LED8_CHABU|nr:hypothetical protein CBR_g31135 [Chara braunii]|eukprot:GBG80676.1 hypothetical protein CBR_g31135 [Chara braunii]